MDILSNGYKKPANGERGGVFYPALNENAQLMNDHVHDGDGHGDQISTKHLLKPTSTIAIADWVAVAGQSGTFRALVTLPDLTVPTFTHTNCTKKFMVDSGSQAGTELFLHVEKHATDADKFYVYINDNSIDVKVIYG